MSKRFLTVERIQISNFSFTNKTKSLNEIIHARNEQQKQRKEEVQKWQKYNRKSNGQKKRP